jgi:phosphoglycolate phosphatase
VTDAAVRYDLVIFDLDGTLIDSIGDIADALNAALGERGLPPLSDAAVARMVGSGVDALVRQALDVARHREREAWVADVGLRYRALYSERPLARTGLYLGVRETLARLRARGLSLAVATNKPGALARTIVSGLRLADELPVVLGEDDVGRRKPDPLIVDIIRGTIGAPRGRTLYVGDSLVDADTADAARVDLALVTWGYADPAAIRARAARHHIERFPELLRVVASDDGDGGDGLVS